MSEAAVAEEVVNEIPLLDASRIKLTVLSNE